MIDSSDPNSIAYSPSYSNCKAWKSAKLMSLIDLARSTGLTRFGTSDSFSTIKGTNKTHRLGKIYGDLPV